MKPYRHRNGNGLAYGEGVHLSADTFFDKDSEAHGETLLLSSSAAGSSFEDSFAYLSRFSRIELEAPFSPGPPPHVPCLVRNSRVSHARVIGSVVLDSSIAEAEIINCRLRDCVVEPLHGIGPMLLSVRLEGVTVSGDVCLRGPWEMRGPYRIDAGEWGRSPIHKLIEGENGVSVGLSECTEGRAHVACRCAPVERWLTKGPRVARRLGWTEGQISSAVAFLEGLR